MKHLGAVLLAVWLVAASAWPAMADAAFDHSLVALQGDPLVQQVASLGHQFVPDAYLPDYETVRARLNGEIDADQVCDFILLDNGYLWTGYDPARTEAVWIPASSLMAYGYGAAPDVTTIFHWQGRYYATRNLYGADGAKVGVIGVIFRLGFTPGVAGVEL